MQFKIKKELIGGRYFVRLGLTEFTEIDQAKADTFGEPTLLIKQGDGKELQVKIKSIERFSVYGFYKREEADQYAENIKLQIADLKNRWDTLKDSWSNEEII